MSAQALPMHDVRTDSRTDEVAFRAHFSNDRICDHARRDPAAGRHKHWLRGTFDSDVVQCCVCGKSWHRPEAAKA